MVVLGIDPGYAIVGYGAIEHHGMKNKLICCGAITTKAHTPLHLRLEEIYRDTLTLLDQVKPDAVAIEELFFNTNITTGIQVAQARGLVAIDAIGLFEGGLAELCDVTVAVTAPVEDRVKRLMGRDGITEEYLKKVPYCVMGKPMV